MAIEARIRTILFRPGVMPWIGRIVDSHLTDASASELLGLGVETPADLAFLWSSEVEIFDSFVDPDIQSQVTAAWRAARVEAEITFARLPEQPIVKKPRVHLPQCAIGARPKKRAIPPVSLLPGPFQVRFVQPGPSRRPDPGDERTPILDMMFEVVLASGCHNVLFGFEGLVRMPLESRPLFDRKLQVVPLEALKGHRRAFKRWVTYHAEHCPAEMPYWQPPALALSQFLLHVSRGGPTAAKGVYSALKWWREALGIPLPVMDGLVAHWAVAEPGHCATPKPPMSVDVLLAVLSAAPRLRGTMASAAAWLLLPLVACLRFAHVQRSSQLKLVGDQVRGVCSKGKRRVGHVRPPFEWAAPARVGGFELGKQLVLDFEETRARLPHADFLIPDIAFGRANPLAANSAKLLTKMSIGKFTLLLRAVVQAIVPAEDGHCGLCSYSLRRFLPTVADKLMLPGDLRDAIGGWHERPQTATEAVGQSREHAAHAMAVRYADDKVATAGEVKKQVLVALLMACSRMPPKSPRSWEAVAAYAPEWSQVVRRCRDSSVSMNTEAQGPVEHVQEASSSSSSSSSSSDSEVSDMEMHAPWFRQRAGGQLHLLHSVVGNRLVPWCRDVPFARLHVERGQGLEDTDDVCQKCWARAPLVTRESMRA